MVRQKHQPFMETV